MTRTELTAEDLAGILAPFDLRLRPRGFERLEKGTINSNWRVDTDGGRVFVRVNEGKRESDVRYEGELLWHLCARRFPTPPPLRTAAGEPFVRHRDRLVTVFPFWPGHELRPEDMNAERAGHVGEVLERLHRAAADFPHAREGIYTFERIAARVEGFRARAADVPAIAEALSILDDEIAWQRNARPALAQLPSGTIHGDLFPDNLLWVEGASRRGPGLKGPRISAVLDFEQASIGRFGYDLAVTLLAWCWADDRLDEALAWAMVAGYQRARRLAEEERDALWIEARAAALRFTVTRITDVFLPSLPPASIEPRPGKDFRDYLARLRFLREQGREALGLAVDDRPPLRAV